MPNSTSRTLLTLAGTSAVLTAAYYLAHYRRRTSPLDGRAEVIAHRGGPAYAPENTLAAFARAVALGADRLECDVQMTRDGELIVIHDETLERTTNGRGRVADHTLAELRALDAGAGERLPTFREFVEAGRAAGVALLPEIKSPHLYPGIEVKVLAELEAARYLDRTVIQSFDFDCLRRLRQLKPLARLGALYDVTQFDTAFPPADAEFIGPPAELVLLNPGLVRAAHAQGRRVFVWFNFVEHPLAYRGLLAFGVDGLIADDPRAARRAIRRRA